MKNKESSPIEFWYPFSATQQKKLNEFFDEVDDDTYTGAIGGRYTYQFTPTSLGMIVKCVDSVSKREVNLTNYDTW